MVFSRTKFFNWRISLVLMEGDCAKCYEIRGDHNIDLIFPLGLDELLFTQTFWEILFESLQRLVMETSQPLPAYSLFDELQRHSVRIPLYYTDYHKVAGKGERE